MARNMSFSLSEFPAMSDRNRYEFSSHFWTVALSWSWLERLEIVIDIFFSFFHFSLFPFGSRNTINGIDDHRPITKRIALRALTWTHAHPHTLTHIQA